MPWRNNRCTSGRSIPVLSYWGTALLRSPSPTTDRDRTVSRRSEPSSRTALMGGQPNPWEPNPAPGCDEPTSRCQTSPSMWTLGRDQPVIPRVAFIRWATALPFGTAGSLSPTFVPVRLVCLTVKHASAICTLGDWFPSNLSVPLGASVTLWEATAPVKLPTWHCPRTCSRYQVRTPVTQEWYPNGDSSYTGVHVSLSPTYPVHVWPEFNIRLQ